MESDKFKLGLFIVLFFIVLCAVFVVFGLFDYGANKAKVSTTFTESVQGLEIGSLVKLRGVPVGKVTDITVAMDIKIIRVDMELDLNKIYVQSSERNDDYSMLNEHTFYKMFSKEIKAGLRTQLEMGGITGMKYVEMDYLPENSEYFHLKPTDASGNINGTFYIPSRPSMLAGIKSNLTEVMAKIASIDFKKISEDTEKILQSADKLLSDPHLKETIQNLDTISEKIANITTSMDKSFPEERMKQIAEELLTVIEEMRKIPHVIDDAVQEAKIAETTKSFREVAGSIRDSRESIQDSLVKINELADAMTELIKSLDKNPQSIIYGKQQNGKSN